MHQKQVNSENISSEKTNKDSLLEKFSEPIQIKNNSKFSNIHKIDEKISQEMSKIAQNIINVETTIHNSKDTKEIINSINEFFKKTKLGKYEFNQRTGRNVIKIQEITGINHTQFIKKFFEIIFADYLKNYQYEIIDKNNSVCVLFR